MTTQGTQETEPVKVEKKRTNPDKSIDVVVRWDISKVKEIDPETGEESKHWEYERFVLEGLKPNCPESEYDNWIQANARALQLKAKARANNLTTEEMKEIIDLETGDRIDSRIHAAASQQEQIGILRYAITELYNRLGESVPTELSELNSIANEEISAGQDRKSNL